VLPGGNAIVLPGITIGRGVTVGAGSVVTKDVPPFHCVAGNPARIIRRIEINSPEPLLE
jgi:acetyltransferase-like isoleucine patch superfamily enzyme